MCLFSSGQPVFKYYIMRRGVSTVTYVSWVESCRSPSGTKGSFHAWLPSPTQKQPFNTQLLGSFYCSPSISIAHHSNSTTGSLAAVSVILCRPSLFPRLSETALIQGGPSFQAFFIAQNYLKHQHAYCQTSALATTICSHYLYTELTASIMNKHGEILLGLVDPWRMPRPSPTVTVHVWLDHGGLEGVSLMCPQPVWSGSTECPLVGSVPLCRNLSLSELIRIIITFPR